MTPDKVIIVVSANDCVKCMFTLESVIQNSTEVDSLFLYFESKRMKELFEKDHNNKKNIFFYQNRNLDDHLLINGQSTVHLYKGLTYKRLLLKNIVNVKRDMRFNMIDNAYRIKDISVEPGSTFISTTYENYLIYNKYTNLLHLLGINNDKEIAQQILLNNNITEKDYNTVISYYLDNSSSDTDSILDYNASIEIMNKLRLPTKTVSSISILKDKIFIFTQLYFCKFIISDDEKELVHQGIDFVYTYKFDLTNTDIYLENIKPLNEVFVNNRSGNQISINPFGKHQVVNNSWVFSPSITIKDSEIIIFDPISIGILYDEKFNSSENKYFSLPDDYDKYLNETTLKQSITNNSILLTDLKDQYFLYNRVLHKAINLQPESDWGSVLDVQLLLRILTANTINLKIDRIMAGEILDNFLYLCFYESDVGLRLLKFNLINQEYEINSLESLSTSGRLMDCAIIGGKLNYSAYDFEKEIITIYTFNY